MAARGGRIDDEINKYEMTITTEKPYQKKRIKDWYLFTIKNEWRYQIDLFLLLSTSPQIF